MVLFQYCCTVETGTVPIPYSWYTVLEGYRTVPFCTSFRYHSSTIYRYWVPDDQCKHGQYHIAAGFLVYSKNLIQKRYSPLQPSTCTVPDSTVCVSVLGWIPYEYSTDQYRYSTQVLLFACIHLLIPTPIHFKMTLKYYMYHKFFWSKLHDVRLRRVLLMINISSGDGLVANMHQAIAWTNAHQGFSWGMLLESHDKLKVIHGWLQLTSHASYWCFSSTEPLDTNSNTWQDIVFLVCATFLFTKMFAPYV